MGYILAKLGMFLVDRYCEPDVAGMTREQLGLFNQPLNLKGLTLEQKKSLSNNARRLLKDKDLIYIMDLLVEETLAHMLFISDPHEMILERMGINKITQLKEKIKEISLLVTDEVKQEFDKFAVI